MSVRFTAKQLFGDVKVGEKGMAELFVHNVDNKYSINCMLSMHIKHNDHTRMHPCFSLKILTPRIQCCQFTMRAHLNLTTATQQQLQRLVC